MAAVVAAPPVDVAVDPSLPDTRLRHAAERLGVNAREVLAASFDQTAARSQLAKPLAVLNGKRPGPKRKSSTDEADLVLALRAQGLTIREIASRVFGDDSPDSGRGKVSRLLKSRPVT